MTYAPTLSARLGLSTETIVRAHDVVCSMMGSDWLDAQTRPRGTSTWSIADTHPLYTALTGRTDDNVLEVIHLAGYLQGLRDAPGLGKAIVSLRDAGSYDPTVFELDLAWKFRSAGAAIRLFPETPNGVADFAAELHGGEHIVEASGFPSDPLRDGSSSFIGAMGTTFVSALRKANIAVPLSLELDLEDVAGRTREATFAAVKELVRELNSNSTIERAYEFGTVTIRPMIPGEGPSSDKWTIASRLGRSPLDESRLFGETEYRIQGAGAWVYLRDRTKAQDPYVRLRSKLKSEARQLSGCTSGLIILDIEALGADVINNRAALEPAIIDFARQHRSTTGVAIVVRPVTLHDRQRGLSGHYFPLADTALSIESWKSIVKADEKADLLHELGSL